MTQDHLPDAPEPIDPTPAPAEALPDAAGAADAPAPAQPSPGGAKLFVIFFLILVPLIGMAVLATLIYGLLTRMN